MVLFTTYRLIYLLFMTYFIENCPLSETILSLEEPTFQDFIFIGVGILLLIAAEIDKEKIRLLLTKTRIWSKCLENNVPQCSDRWVRGEDEEVHQRQLHRRNFRQLLPLHWLCGCQLHENDLSENIQGPGISGGAFNVFLRVSVCLTFV